MTQKKEDTALGTPDSASSSFYYPVFLYYLLHHLLYRSLIRRPLSLKVLIHETGLNTAVILILSTAVEIDPEYLTDTWDTMEQKFYEGKTGIIAGTLSSTQIYDNKMRSVNGEESELVILPPAKGVAQGYRAEDVTKEERGFAMNIDSKNKDAAWAVLEFMASPEGRILDKVGIN